ncbi:unnamed protein product, partial [Owenia fusiformis]
QRVNSKQEIEPHMSKDTVKHEATYSDVTDTKATLDIIKTSTDDENDAQMQSNNMATTSAQAIEAISGKLDLIITYFKINQGKPQKPPPPPPDFTDTRLLGITIDQFYKLSKTRRISHKTLTELVETLPPYTGIPKVKNPYVIDKALVKSAAERYHFQPKMFVDMIARNIFTLGEIKGRNYMGKSSRNTVVKKEISIPKKNALEAAVSKQFPSLKKEEVAKTCRDTINRRIRYIFDETLGSNQWFALDCKSDP